MKRILTCVIPFFLIACNTTTPTSTYNPIVTKAKSPEKLPDTFVYDSEGKEEFAFGEVSEVLQKYAYSDICYRKPGKYISSDCALNRLAYKDYVGKRGYYTGAAPITDLHGNIAKEAILETGEVVYILSSSKYEHVGKDIIPIDEYKQIHEFEPEPIVAGSDILVTGYSKLLRGQLNVSSQKKHSFTPEEIESIRNIAE